MTMDYDGPFGCSVEAALSVIGGRWKAVILFKLLESDVLRFGELQRAIPEVRQKMLTNQLRELENDGIINRKVYPVVPPKVEYSLTEYGKSLKKILMAMKDWGALHQEKIKLG
jgi:DNA-binding HxlR family transcriptional regulator